jgi:hypothetical protein
VLKLLLLRKALVEERKEVVGIRSRSISSSEGFRDERKKRVKKKSENIRKEGSRTEEERDPCPKRR